jgi:hypothetical protein
MNYSSNVSRRFLSPRAALILALAGACVPPPAPVAGPAPMPEVEEAARREVALAWARERGGESPVVRRAEVLAWETLEDARPVRFSQAVVWLELVHGGRTGYALASLARGTHPPEWQGRTAVDGPYLGARFFDRPVRADDICSLVAAPNGWTRPSGQPGDFRVVAGEASPAAWQRATGTATVPACIRATQ